MDDDNTEIVSRDEAFLKKLREIVLKNLKNEQFSVKALSLESGYSRSQLYRKIKLINGKSVSQFIRDTRLEEALKLIVNDSASISEIAYKVGFNSPNYFSRSFHKRYNYTPLEVRCMAEKDVSSKVLSKLEGFSKIETKRYKPFNIQWGITFAVLFLSAVVFMMSYKQNRNLKPVLRHSYTFDNGSAKDIVGEAHGRIKGAAKIENGLFITSEQGQYIELPADKIRINEYSAITLEVFLLAIGDNTGASVVSYFGAIYGRYGVNFIFQSISNEENSLSAISCKKYTAPWETGTHVFCMPLHDNQYHHIVTTFDDYNLKFYVDGNLIGTKTNDENRVNTINNLGNDYAFLCKSGFAHHKTWIGVIDAFNIYDGILDSEAIKDIAKTYLENSRKKRTAKVMLNDI